ncbi:MAG: hypothetical protein HY901_06350 [Deltaproteobacteria bacterium]|nr:hypothetical protein [Deltaproteobacteria bacterium]
MRLLAALALALLIPVQALAWSTEECPGHPGYRLAYPSGGAVWPIEYLSNMSSSNRSAASNSMLDWNAIYGANDNLTVGASGYGYCQETDYAGLGVFGWDDGSCTAWSSTTLGVTIKWFDVCTIKRISLYLNSSYYFSPDELHYAMTHELGHYQIADHDWYELSVMGYSDSDPMTFLTAPDHAFLRAVYPSGNTAAPDLYITRFVQRDYVIPDVASFTVSPLPNCAACDDLLPGDEIAVTLTYGHAGSRAVSGSFDIVMTLGTHVLGRWTVSSYPAHAQNTYEFIGTVPSGLAVGSYSLTVEVDPSGAVAQSSGPTPPDAVTFTGFAVRAPASWFCSSSLYGSGGACDCECGAYDPDCSSASATVVGCSDANACTDDRCDAYGACAHPANTATCEDGLYCTTSDRCSGAACQSGSARDCSAQTSACSTGRCDESLRRCARDPTNEGGACDDGLYCTVSEACTSGACQGSARDCSTLDDQCAVGQCDEARSACVPAPAHEASSCNDGLRCTVTDVCRSGACAGTPRDCSALNAPCKLGKCDEATGGCVAVDVPDGLSCDDGIYCSVGETCAAGVCGGGAPRDCSGASSACLQGRCDENARRCITAAANEGGPCDDGKYCSIGDHCANGTCVGSSRDCSALDSICTAGACDETKSSCVAQPANQGGACDDSAYCTVGDHCSAGSCVGSARDCSSLDATCTRGSCNEAQRACVSVPGGDGTSCEDGHYCTVDDTCEGGTCHGGAARDCSDQETLCQTAHCDEATRRCAVQPRPDGTSCEANQLCTVDNVCRAGSCQGTPRDCSTFGGPCSVGICDPSEGCVAEPIANGTGCEDDLACTISDQCLFGECIGSALDCSALDDECTRGSCDEGQRGCVRAPLPDGTRCTTQEPCAASARCRSGECGAAPRDCSSLSDACNEGYCEPGGGRCQSRPRAEGCNPPAASGCGCSTPAGSPLIAGLLGLIGLSRRRRAIR